ncbi:Rne/Rng family ribonuclease [Spirulina subsalsa FACHB-351]|uniref:Rne/Rng family ribonuclease n=1 Tax=Spirulina subsalsa FACHB-351 TaxID=234711 RepID=A0ABT3L4N4_9CYAN|nr:Rne/Rng family ribonuclease [Spirulina subsalsa]MCW6036054.1 Rne/Rng family ribonuclease [Spirulina subsalsa FACHB-351]
MPKQIIIAEQHKIAAVFAEDQIQELVVSTGNQQVSDIYLGTVENVIQGIDAAFVNIGDAERNGFMHVTDLGPLRLRKSAGAITELLTPQQTVLVQVMKEPTGNKGPRLTGNITLPGRYLVLMPYGRGVNLSRRIKNEAERSRLRALAILIKPAGMGLLVRTEAEGKGEDAIMEDLEYLQRQWESIQQQANMTKPPALLNRDEDFIQRILRDIYSAEVNRIVVDSAAGVKRVKQQLMNWSGGRSPEGVLIDHHRDRLPILEYFRVNAAIREALKPRVDLPSGGYIIIEPTEALTVIDVNSGSFTRSATARETVLWTNYEAATEIARQMRLRNMGGVIVVDFIDMDSRRDQLALLEHFNKTLRADKARPQIAQLSELGLVELTRKRQGQNLYELFGKECPHCGGLGHLVQLPGESGEELPERVVSTTPTLVRTPEKREEEIEGLFDVGGDESSADLDLLHHPSYQEPGGNNKRRRRRRLSELELGNKSKPRPSGTNGQKLDTDNDYSGNNESYGILRDSSGGRERDSSDKYSSSRSSRIRETIIPEKVSVEMTPVEQDIYAIMGISPLIRVDRELKDPKAVIVSVRPVGTDEGVEEEREKPAKPILNNTVESPSTVNELDSQPDEEEIEENSPVISEEFVPSVESVQSVESVESGIDDPELESNGSNTEEEEDRPVIRRRRRRSSAR